MTLKSGFIGALCVGFIIFVYFLSAMLTPFIIGFVLAYLLNPFVQKMTSYGFVTRRIASLVPVLASVGIFLTALAIGVPALVQQLTGFAKRLPFYTQTAHTNLMPFIEKIFGSEIQTADLIGRFGTYGKDILITSLTALEHVALGAMAFVDFISFLLITPLVAYYMLQEWPHITKWLHKLVPVRYAKHSQKIMHDIDLKLAAFFRGQFLVALILAIFYGACLKFIGLEMAAALGALAGILVFIPMIGSIISVMVIMGVALVQFQFTDWIPYGQIAALFITGSLLESFVLTPKFIGKRLGLHPIWIIFALMAGGTLAGFIGMLIAVPIAAICSVICPVILKNWQSTSFYKAKK